jgi:predicted DCC family thiol-disulfide oxidoreductase YuxK
VNDDVFVYDDDCGFCTWWAELFEDRAGLRIVGFSELSPALRERLPDEYETCSHLVTDENVYSCGASVEEALLRTDPGSSVRPAVERLQSVDRYRNLREWAYRRGANNRAVWGNVVSKTPPARKQEET